MMFGCYTMDLYCRNGMPSDGEPKGCRAPKRLQHPHPCAWAQFVGETYGECRRQANRRGWVFNRDGDVTCRHCARAAGVEVVEVESDER